MSPPIGIEAQERIVQAARAFVGGELDTIRAALEIGRWRLDVDPDQRDPDLLAFEGIASQVDDLLVVDSVRGWPPAVKEQKDAEYAEAERFFRADAINRARALIARYGRPA